MIFQQLQVCMHAGLLQAHRHVFSFFTRNLFRPAPDLLATLKQHDQAIDPNLQRLADAFQMVASKLGPDAVMAQLKGETASGTNADEELGEAGTVGEGGGVALVADYLEEGLQQLRKEMLLGDSKHRKRNHKRYAVGLMASRKVFLECVGACVPVHLCLCSELQVMLSASTLKSCCTCIVFLLLWPTPQGCPNRPFAHHHFACVAFFIV
jgi:hypothetical protein